VVGASVDEELENEIIEEVVDAIAVTADVKLEYIGTEVVVLENVEEVFE
jgi:hypothetical protein